MIHPYKPSRQLHQRGKNLLHDSRTNLMSRTMINIIESKGNSGVSTTTSSKKLPRNICNNGQQPKSNMAADTGNSVSVEISFGGRCALARSADCDLCEKKKHWRYKPYPQCLMKGFKTAKFTSNSQLQEFRLT